MMSRRLTVAGPRVAVVARPRRPVVARRRVGVVVGFLFLHPLLAASQLSGQQLTVGPDGEFPTIGAAVASAEPGDTVLVAAGTYAERLRIRAHLTLRGEGWPVIDGGGEGHVVEALAPLVLEGFVVRGSGAHGDEEHAGVMVRAAPGSRIVGNRFEDVFYGIYLKESPGSLVMDNRIEGKPFPPPRRGDGIRLWYSSGTQILENEVRGTRDVVVYFSDSLLVRDNVVLEGRYGLHYMYSHHNVFEGNRFDGNDVGAFLMYSKDIQLRDNVFANSAGSTGMGLGLKDADAIRVTGNLIVGNVIGVHLDNSPSSTEQPNIFAENLLVGNEVGVRLLPAVRANEFEANEFVSNGSPVAVAGGTNPGQASRNLWAGNHWTEYAGFDQDQDGLGDTPFVHARLADDLRGRYPELGLFALSPALAVLEVVSRFFPLLKPEPVVVDASPRLQAARLVAWTDAGRAATAQDRSGGSLWLAAAWLCSSVAAGLGLWRLAKRRKP